jgi:hypothetical protein
MSPRSHFSFSLRVVPTDPVDDDRVSLRYSLVRRATCISIGWAAQPPNVLGGRRAPRRDGQREPPTRFTALTSSAVDDRGLR